MTRPPANTRSEVTLPLPFVTLTRASLLGGVLLALILRQPILTSALFLILLAALLFGEKGNLFIQIGSRLDANRMAEAPQLTKGERTRARILEVAEAMFAAQGYEATTLRDIAKEVPIQQPGLYNYFETKDDLYGAVIEKVFKDMLESFVSFSREIDASDRTEELPIRTVRYLSEHPLSAQLLYRELLKGDDIHPVMERWVRQLLAAATQPLDAMGVGPRDRLIVVLAMYNAVAGFFAVGPTIAKLMDEHLDFETDGPRHVQLMQRYASVSLPGGKS